MVKEIAQAVFFISIHSHLSLAGAGWVMPDLLRIAGRSYGQRLCESILSLKRVGARPHVRIDARQIRLQEVRAASAGGASQDPSLTGEHLGHDDNTQSREPDITMQGLPLRATHEGQRGGQAQSSRTE